MFLYSSAATILQAIKVAFFFGTLSFPVHHDAGAELRNLGPVSAIYEVERPASNPRRDRN